MFLYPIFKGFSKIKFRSVASVTKKLWAILDFVFTQTRLLDTKFHGESVKNGRSRTKKTEKVGGGTSNAPLLPCLWFYFCLFFSSVFAVVYNQDYSSSSDLGIHFLIVICK